MFDRNGNNVAFDSDAYQRPLRPDNWHEDDAEKFSWLGAGYEHAAGANA